MTTTRIVTIGLLAGGLAACGAATGNDATPSGASGASGAAPAASAPARSDDREPSGRTAPSGTTVEVTIRDEISSRKYSAGRSVEGSVSNDVLDSKGRVVIPAGSGVAIEITRISPSEPGDTRGEGSLELTVTSITVNGSSHDARAVVSDVPHTMKGRGVTKGQGEDIAVGAAVGALAGQLIGKNTRSTVIGGAVGAVGGGAVAVKGSQRDIVVAAGTHITFQLPKPITVN
jgi:hypothetical protein